MSRHSFSEGGFESFGSIDQERLTTSFASRVLKGLEGRGLLDAETVAQILSQEHTGFSVWVGEPFNDQERELFVAGQVERGPISLDKLTLEHDVVTYTTKDGVAHKFDALSYLALLTAHIPNRGESVTRYYGVYSSRSRGERDKRERLNAAAAASNPIFQTVESLKRPSLTWAECMKRVFEFDPLECPKCKSRMRIIAFIQEPQEIEKVMKSQGIAKAQAPFGCLRPELDSTELAEVRPRVAHVEAVRLSSRRSRSTELTSKPPPIPTRNQEDYSVVEQDFPMSEFESCF